MISDSVIIMEVAADTIGSVKNMSLVTKPLSIVTSSDALHWMLTNEGDKAVRHKNIAETNGTRLP